MDLEPSLFQAPREMREVECEGTKTRGEHSPRVFVPSHSPSRISLGAWNRLFGTMFQDPQLGCYNIELNNTKLGQMTNLNVTFYMVVSIYK